MHPERKATAILKRFNGGGKFEHRIADSGQPVAAVGVGEKLGFHNAVPLEPGLGRFPLEQPRCSS